MRRAVLAVLTFTLVLSGCAGAVGVANSEVGAAPTDTATPTGETQMSLGVAGRLSYPATWVNAAGFPAGTTTPLGIVSSLPLAPCAASTCQDYTVPSNGVAVEFRFNAVSGAPPYTGPVNDNIGGYPAFREDWGPGNSHNADEGHEWLLHMPSGVLVIIASIKGPDVATGQGSLQQLLSGVTVTP